jgi:BCD family chlorophyll transporter-like MFS transporter
VGAGLFGHGTLTATMQIAPREQIGLALGDLGRCSGHIAGAGIALGSVLRDIMLALDLDIRVWRGHYRIWPSMCSRSCS